MAKLGISLTHSGRWHYIQFDKSEINEIANMAFVSGRTNRSISNKEPAAYLPNVV